MVCRAGARANSGGFARVEPEDFAFLHQARSIDYSFGAEEIEASQFVVVTEHTPRRFLRRASLDRQLSEARKFIGDFHFKC